MEKIEFAQATGALSGLWLLIALPLAGAAILFLLGRRADKWGHWLGCATIAASFALGLTYVIQLAGQDNKSAVVNLFTFIGSGSLTIKFSLLLDPLSSVFVLLITGVGFLIHVYAVGYMEHDPGRRRFFAFFNLFVAAMLLLVLGNNYVMTFIGWEGVGLASYLLISFWYTKPSAATAGKKAFIMNRVGDAGFLVAIFLMFAYMGSTDFQTVFNSALGHHVASGVILAIGLCLLLGACGKSGQFPLQAWLPDAMEGPTPVSALIHAATMVTAGVYLIARSHAVFSANATAQTVVVSIGALTLVIGCIIGCAKDDIKRVLAYSTVSQIGYMFLGVGLGGGAYALGIIHLLAHGFFKAGLFLGAGSVMHGMKDQVNIRRFGGLWKYMKITWATFGLGYLAIIGIPPLSGFFTKDPIVEAAFNSREGWQGWLFGSAALLGAGLTAFYMTRVFVLTFHGKKRWTDDIEHPHESPPIMTIPLILLACGSVAAGFLMSTSVVTWLTPVFGDHHEAAANLSPTIITIAMIVADVIGVGLAVALFARGTALEPRPARTQIVRAARANLYADRFNELVFELPGRLLTRALVWVDNRGVDGIVNGLAAAVGGGSGRLRRAQTGFVRSYALSILSGAVIVVAALLVVTFG
ncbi:MAG TPA: NADH-quinone oxidoreductase subunit L [Stackebrandtia sp.]|uniref:NADH-quinone oxidoreductase subunit L n=1 Tax=Stackebrandtia sp. TaxID=2023065 RepID=UPI002D59003C|nr:NADH-quinone oxidoreductase subunit L [Stackebrandtia sp.]HZE40732.1 NADH-quinone oxidoreductase subunit L [Stackebrandtia sp.]